MISSDSPIGYKKYSLILIVPLCFIAIAIWVMEAYFGTLYGDLTRIGQLDEEDFGWRLQQPFVAAELLKSYPLTEADILVIGDSFSNSLIWQSRLMTAGFKTATLRWDEFKPCSLAQNLGEIVRQAGFRGRYVIFENVEHGFQNRMNSSCALSSKINGATYYAATPEIEPPSDSTRNFFNRKPLGGDWVINALINKIKLTYLFEANTKYLELGDGRTRVVPMDGCAWFSNKLCKFRLFYSLDFEKNTFNSIGNILTVNADLHKVGIEAIWLAIPDKSTVYLGYGKFVMKPYVNIWEELAHHQELVAPNLAESFKQESRKMKDFYKPNDVHLSTNGYLYLGNLMVDFIRDRESNQVKKILQIERIN
jgi:hypothetical protein